MPKTISVVIPTLNEAASLREVVNRARRVPEVCEVIVADGGSRDGTCDIATELGCKVIRGPAGRGGQMRRGAAEAKGDVILLLHADTWLPPEAGKAVFNCLRDISVSGGGFWKVFRERNPLLLGSRFKCAIRLYLGRRIMGDQAIFARRDVLEKVGGIPDMPLMEEFELCRRLRKVGRLALADATVITSARRFAKLGVARTYLRMWRVTLSYWLGMKPQELRRIYEKE
jgi:rSAM/selenodomain-associated transferase 2